jgi:hypothetical protein
VRCLFAIAFAQYVRYYFTNLTFTLLRLRLYCSHGAFHSVQLQDQAGARFFWILVLFPVLFFLRVDESFLIT